MDEIKNEKQTFTADDVGRMNKLITQSENKLVLLKRERELRNKLQEIKVANNGVNENKYRPHYLYMQDFHNIILELEQVNHENYLTNVNDAVSREESSLKGMIKMIEDAEIEKVESDVKWVKKKLKQQKKLKKQLLNK